METSAEEKRAFFSKLEYVFLATVTETRLAVLPTKERGDNTKVTEIKYDVIERIKGVLPASGVVSIELMSIGDCGSPAPIIAGYEYIFWKRKEDVLSHAIFYDALGTKSEDGEKKYLRLKELANSIGQ